MLGDFAEQDTGILGAGNEADFANTTSHTNHVPENRVEMRWTGEHLP